MLVFLWREKFKGVSHYIFAKKVNRGSAVQTFSNFPAKSLSIYRVIFFVTPLIKI